MLILLPRKIKDMNYSSHKEGAVISATEFHPTSMVGLVAGNKVGWLVSVIIYYHYQYYHHFIITNFL